jgi:hypothetical protein
MTSTAAPLPTAPTATLPRAAAIEGIVGRHGSAERERAIRGVDQVAERWTADDGDAAAFERLCVDAFVPAAKLPLLLGRLEAGLEWIGGHLHELRRHLRRWSDLRTEELAPVDDLLATFDPAPDLSEQWYRQRIAFVALLNLERPDLERMLREGGSWDADRWASVRIAKAFGPRVPKELADQARHVGHAANQWVAKFHVPVGSMVDAAGKRWFEPDRALLAHWLVREEIKAGYGDPEGLAKQRALAWVMARHVDGSIPKAVMAREAIGDWDPQTNRIGSAGCGDPIGLARYEHWLAQRDLAFAHDPYYPDFPTAIRRKCELAREIPEAEVVRLLTDLLRAPARRQLAAFLSRRFGRPLEPFDVYADEFTVSRPADEMNRRVRERFADAAELERKLPEVLRGLGFPAADAEFLGSRIRVEIARGSGHAVRPGLPEFAAWLRTGSLDRELGWDGFDTAMHELGHTLEQIVSTHFVPRPALRNVPNTACTEAFAFLYQSLAKRVLGLDDAGDEQRSFDIDALQTFASACQIAGPALLELRVWNWIYAHPAADAAALRDEVLRVADAIWNEFYAVDFGPDPYRLMAAYQHMIAHPLYLPDYPLGHIMSQQIRAHVRGKDLATETKRICSIGRVTPDLWMRRAVGGPISVDALVADAADAIGRLSR